MVKVDRKKFYTDKRNIVFLASLCCALWGSAYPAIKIGYDIFNIAANDISSKLIFAGTRFALAGIFVLLYQTFSKKNIINLTRKKFGEAAVLGLVQTTLQYICFYIGMAYASGVTGSIVNGTGTFFSIILAHFIYKNDKMNFNKFLGCLIGFTGVVIVNLKGGGGSALGFKLHGEGLVMLSAFLASVAAIYSKRITQNQDAVTITGYQLSIGGVVLMVLGTILGGSIAGFTFNRAMLIIYMALISSVSFVIWTQLMKYNKVGTIAMFNFLIPVFGTVLSGIFLKENIFNLKILLSVLFVSLGIFIVYRKSE